MLEKYLRKLYGGDFDVSTDIEPSAWREVLRILNDAVATGISQSDAAPTLEQDFYDQLRHSNEVFSAFKVHSMGKRMAALLTDESGQLKPFHKWRDEVMPIASHYVGPWLRTEYNTAVNRAHDAADWKQFERNSDIMPNLRWMPTTSAEPDAEHRIFWQMKLTRPIDDPFWNQHRPGDHWNCKCTLEQTDDPATDIPAGADDEAPQPGLKGNPAKTGQIFDRSHPYFPKSCKGCTFSQGGKLSNWWKGFFNRKSNCYACDGFDIVRTFAKLPNLKGAEYVKSLRDITKMKIFKPAGKNIYSAVGKSDKDFDNLMAGAKKAANAGYKVYILPNPKGVRSADFIFERKKVVKMYDLKTITGSGSIGTRLEESIGQSNRVFINLANTYPVRRMASEIKNYFEGNPDALEVIVSVGKKFISVERNFTQKKDYHKQIRKMIEK